MSECSRKYESDFGLPPACVKCGAEPTQPSEVGTFIEIIFDASNGPMNMVFVEVENEKGQSVNVGEWHDQAEGYSALRIPLGQSTARSQEGRVKELEAQILDLKQLVDQGRKLADKQLEVHAQESQTFLSEITKLSGQEGRLRELLTTAKDLLDQTDNSDYFDPSCSDCYFYHADSKDYSKLLDDGQDSKLCEWHTLYVQWLKKIEALTASPASCHCSGPSPCIHEVKAATSPEAHETKRVKMLHSQCPKCGWIELPEASQEGEKE